MIRTTVRLPDDLLEQAQAHAARTGRSFTQLLADALRFELERERHRGATVSRSRPTAAKDCVRASI
jgi:predicted transcriptional regulator